MRVLAELLGHEAQQALLDFVDVLAWRDARAVGDAIDVRVNRDRRLPEGDVEHHVRRLAAHAGQRFERGAVGRYFAAMLLDQDLRQPRDVLRLGAEQADGADVGLEPFGAERGDRACTQPPGRGRTQRLNVTA